MSVTIVKGWIKEAIGIYYPAKSFGPFTRSVRFGVIHGTASPGASAQNIANDWANNPGDASAHILINKDGTFVQGISLDYSAWGNGNNTGHASYLPTGNPNGYSISMEHCKDDPKYNSDVITPAQQATSFELWDAICDYHQIPRQVVTVGDITQGGIIRHSDIDPEFRTYCPGPYPFGELQAFLNGGHHMNSFIGVHANDFRVQLWRSFSRGVNQAPPREGTGIFTEWVAQLNLGVNKGSPSGAEYPLTLASGETCQAQNFGSNTCIWHEASASAEWL